MHTQPYSMGAIRYTYQCSPFIPKFGIIRDAPQDALRNQAWETFGVPALNSYFASGVEKFRNAFEDFTDESYAVSSKDEVHLQFMLEALIHARQLLTETKSS